jgi:signal transduction histidine kinase
VQTRQIHLDLKLPDTLPPLVSSAISLERVLNELLHNACKYTPPGETIQLSAYAPSADTLELRVKNTGVEIPEDEQPRVFEKFYRVPRSDRWKQGGTGLGLTLVQQLMARLGGQIALQSGGGETQFILQLPFQNPQVLLTDEA